MASAPWFQQRRRSYQGVGQIPRSSGCVWNTHRHTHNRHVCLLGQWVDAKVLHMYMLQLYANLCIDHAVWDHLAAWPSIWEYHSAPNSVRKLHCQRKWLRLKIWTCNRHQHGLVSVKKCKSKDLLFSCMIHGLHLHEAYRHLHGTPKCFYISPLFTHSYTSRWLLPLVCT